MVQNVEQILSRGERIELLVDKTDVMAGQATAFRRGARSVRRQMWWKNQKVLALCFIVALVKAQNKISCFLSIVDPICPLPRFSFTSFLLNSAA